MACVRVVGTGRLDVGVWMCSSVSVAKPPTCGRGRGLSEGIWWASTAEAPPCWTRPAGHPPPPRPASLAVFLAVKGEGDVMCRRCLSVGHALFCVAEFKGISNLHFLAVPEKAPPRSPDSRLGEPTQGLKPVNNFSAG